ncbi:MAG: hypothetical protein FXF47_09030 [Candidatus Mcinerneyibacterium aminivorans]|uniref:6-bladed beta-propeller n=1 Tax=Candidatus Mcinerneyibacterium aminivorans TaxID=2703815 RepID=A0A5D0MGV1_9BACT|nr:MAG: hypothetical protein FXF47_09030 [Candidatus Mcinerneyibacterium aminivorans]
MKIRMLLLLLLLLLFYLISCKSNNTIIQKGKIKDISNIELKKPLLLQKIIKYKNYYISKDKIQKKIVLINKNGTIIKEYGNTGKGPGQFSDSFYPIDVYKGILYIHDLSSQKIIKLKLIAEKPFIKYLDEFHLNEGSSYKADVKKGKIYISYITGKYQLYVYNSKGTILEKHFRMKERNPFKNKDVLKKYVNGYYSLNDNYLLKAGRMSGNLTFYKKENNKYKVIKKTNLSLPEDVIKRKKKPGSYNIKGIVYVENKEGRYFVIPNPGEKRVKIYVLNETGDIVGVYKNPTSNYHISSLSYLNNGKVSFQVYTNKKKVNANIIKVGELNNKRF